MKIILDKSGKGFKITKEGYKKIFEELSEYQYDALYHLDTFEQNLSKIVNTFELRTNLIIIQLIKEFPSMLENQFIICDIFLPDGIRINDLNLHVEQCEENGFAERVVYEICNSLNETSNDKVFQEYVEKMQKIGIREWKIGWESIYKYEGRKIYNRVSKTIGTVQSQLGNYPVFTDEYGNSIPYTADEFKHGSGSWIYIIGEEYDK